MKIIYINGINTTEQEANEQVAFLNEILRDAVTLCYNPTFSNNVPVIGSLVDLAESFYNRAMPWAPDLPVTRKLSGMVDDGLDTFDYVTVIAHSQGIAIAANALKSLLSPNRGFVKAIFFANINSYEPEGVEGEIFLNDEDYVHSNLFISNFFLRIYHLFSKPKNRWKKYTRRGSGHAFFEKYLKKLKEFTGFRESMFCALMKDEAPYKAEAAS